MDRLAGKVIVITGATKGIGRGIAFALAQEGAHVVVGGRSCDEGKSVVSQISSEYGKKALFVCGDIREEAYCKHLIDSAVERFGKIDGLVNNAGIFPVIPFFECKSEDFDNVYAVNVRGTFLCSKYAAMAMEKTGGGSLVHIGSTHAFGASPQYSLYGSSKGAMYSLSSYLARNLARLHIRSNWISVGWVATEGEIARIKADGHDEKWLEELAEKLIPLGALQSSQDIANGVIYLLSDESRFTTESDIKITGGFFPHYD